MAGSERKSCSARFLDLLLYKLYACTAGSRVSGEKIQRYAGNIFFPVLSNFSIFGRLKFIMLQASAFVISLVVIN